MCDKCRADKAALVGVLLAGLAASNFEALHAQKFSALVEEVNRAPEDEPDEVTLERFAVVVNTVTNAEALDLKRMAGWLETMASVIAGEMKTLVLRRVQEGNDEGIDPETLAQIREALAQRTEFEGIRDALVGVISGLGGDRFPIGVH